MNFYKNGMKLGLDFHGVIDADPNFFVDLSNLVVYKLLGEVHIVTGSPYSEKLFQRLVAYNGGRPFWTHFFSIQTFMTEKGFKHILDDKGYPHFAPADWNLVKGNYCQEHGIDMHIDDQWEYLQHFTTPCMLYRKDPAAYKGAVYKPLFKEKL